MMKYTDCMVDIETLDTRPSAVITQIAFVFCDKLDPEKPCQGYTYDVAVPEQIRMERTVSESSWNWWMDRPPALIKRVLSGTTPMVTVLHSLYSHWEKHSLGDTLIWGNGASFDQPILEHAFNMYSVKTPWNFRNSACFRTLLRERDPNGLLRVEPDVAHNALSDALAQAETLHRIYANGR